MSSDSVISTSSTTPGRSLHSSVTSSRNLRSRELPLWNRKLGEPPVLDSLNSAVLAMIIKGLQPTQIRWLNGPTTSLGPIASIRFDSAEKFDVTPITSWEVRFRAETFRSQG